MLFFRCAKELEINDPSKQVTIAYAIINPSDPVQYFKIYKGFLTSGNAYKAAQDINNLYYHVDSIDVKLIEYVGSNPVDTFTLATMDSIREEGTFSSKQILYYMDKPINENAEYKLQITLASGKTMSAQVPMCKSFAFYMLYEGEKIDLTVRNPSIQFKKSGNATGYDIYQVFYYIEVDKVTGEKLREGSVKRKLNSEMIIDNTPSNARISYKYNGPAIYTAIANQVKPNSGVVRYRRGYESIEFQVYSAEKNLIGYINANTPSSSIGSDTQPYTNFESDDNSAYGIFSSKNFINGIFDISSTGGSEDSLVHGAATRGLGFDYWRNRPEGIE
jgi:hypothetical protein